MRVLVPRFVCVGIEFAVWMVILNSREGVAVRVWLVFGLD